MIMKNYFMKSSMMLMAVSAALASCTQEDVLQNTSAQPSDNELKLSVSTQDFVSDAQGRAITNNDETRTSKFENGDQMGLYIFSEDGEVLCDNLLYTYNEDKWTTDKTIYQYKNAQYVAYFPYCKDLSGVAVAENNAENDAEGGAEGSTPSITEIVTKNITDYFTTNILKTVSQTDAETYEQADLMVAIATQVTGEDVSLALKHQFSMIELNIPCRKYITSATDGFQYAAPVKMNVKINEKTDLYRAADGVYRMIVAPETTPVIEGRVVYDENMPIYFSSKSEGVTMNALAAGTFTQFNVTYTDPAVQGLQVDQATGRYIRDLKPGDYYYSDGTIYPYDENKANQPFKEGCIGVIFEVGTGAPGIDWTHGSVLALNNAHSDWSKWGIAGGPKDGNSAGETELYTFLSGKMDGYDLTGTFTTEVDRLDCAFNKIKVFGTTSASEDLQKYTAPEGSSGWYMPSAGQLMAVWSGLGGYKVTDANYMNNMADDHANKLASVQKIQEAIEKVGGTFVGNSGTDSDKNVQRWWSTTEWDDKNVWTMEWNLSETANGWSTGFSSRNKVNGWNDRSTQAYARPILSF